jgi:hypothetical protein
MILGRTISTLFLIKTFKIGSEKLNKVGFVNAFSKDLNYECVYEDCVYVLFKPSDMDVFREFLIDEYERVDNIVDDYDYAGGYVVVVYKLDSNFKEDYDLIRQGLYSKTSKDFQDLFPKIMKVVINGKSRDEISLQYRIFNRTQDLINYWENKLGCKFSENQEVWEGFHEEKETLNIKQLHSNVEKIRN